MGSLEHVDPRDRLDAWKARLGLSREAAELYLSSDVIDLHIDSFIWTRLFGYELTKRHGRGLLGGYFYSQVDFPRLLEASISGATWVITTNPWRTAAGRAAAFVRNFDRLRRTFESVSSQLRLVRTVREYRQARAEGCHGAFVGIQGGNALDPSSGSASGRRPDATPRLDLIPDDSIVRITLVHLSTSRLGTTSFPISLRPGAGLTNYGRDYIKRLNDRRILVDLAHINRQGFFDAVEVHDKSQPLIVTHTGVSAVHRHWRNIDDDQLGAIAATGGTVGIMYQSTFLGDPFWKGRARSVVDHLEHIVRVVGEDHASLGSDWDGAIIPPRDMPTCLELPKLVQLMLERGWSADRIRKILGGNFLRTLEALRG